MAEKTDTEVLIGGRVFTLSGYESEEYLQKIALYINNKVSEYNKVEGFKRQPVDTQAILLELNIADDYFKAKKQISLLEEDLAAKEKELYDLKHELVSAQIKLESTEKAMKSMQDDRSRESKKYWLPSGSCFYGETLCQLNYWHLQEIRNALWQRFWREQMRFM